MTGRPLDDVGTLQEAHEVVRRDWPGRGASAEDWLAHHERAAAVYAHVADVDAGHHHEAVFWASQERQAVRELAGDRQEV